jgi:hypothetical protein
VQAGTVRTASGNWHYGDPEGNRVAAGPAVDNNPECAEPMPVAVRAITGPQQLKEPSVTPTTFLDTKVKIGPSQAAKAR